VLYLVHRKFLVVGCDCITRCALDVPDAQVRLRRKVNLQLGVSVPKLALPPEVAPLPLVRMHNVSHGGGSVGRRREADPACASGVARRQSRLTGARTKE